MSYEKLLGRGLRLLTAAGAVALVVMAAWTVIDVSFRYAASQPLRGSIDLVETAMVLVVFLALPTCFAQDEQITVDVLDHALRPRGVELLKLIAAMSSLIFASLLAYAGWEPLMDAIAFGDRKPDLPIPILGLLSVIEVSLAATVVVLGGKSLRQARRVLKGGEA